MVVFLIDPQDIDRLARQLLDGRKPREPTAYDNDAWPRVGWVFMKGPNGVFSSLGDGWGIGRRAMPL